jgi:hypothetical protein
VEAKPNFTHLGLEMFGIIGKYDEICGNRMEKYGPSLHNPKVSRVAWSVEGMPLASVRVPTFSTSAVQAPHGQLFGVQAFCHVFLAEGPFGRWKN